ncbi:NADH-quinone oxidoreductase subunit A [Bdellovibrio sp. HCB337]|uniref:NADH-quinone oxidoreductase subunit A n=1 Tax=Bdellovibrio sp. HCB337 TaxID=3394358 RepID=UPI0039A65AF1
MPLGGVIFITVFVAVFGCLCLYLGRTFGGKKPQDAVKLAPYECGIPGQEKKDTKVSVKFYLTAILFILFDIEIIFMYPWATSFKDMIASGIGGYALIAMMIFIVVFIFGLFWEIKSKALEWD